VKVKHTQWEGVPHYFWMFPGIGGALEFFAGVVGGVKFVLEN
jgi:hypothetical protein